MSTNLRRKLLCITAITLCSCWRPVAAEEGIAFDRILLTEEFSSEGACFADIDGDGQNDVVSGPYWYRGPDFRQRTAYMGEQVFSVKQYSSHFFSFAHDVNADGRTDIVVVGFPGAAAIWFENPQRENFELSALWNQHVIIDEVSNESPTFADITGDGVPELVCISDGDYGYAQPGEDPTQPWNFTKITRDQNLGRFTHGMGVGDVNGDGRPDLLETRGWWEQTATPGELFKFHAYPFAQSGGSQMFAHDFDGDGDNDVVAVQNAHGWGLKWFEQRGNADDIGFIAHDILPDRELPADQFNVSQMHALALADIDGDGVQDIVTGKRFFAHGGGDPGAYQPPVLIWLRTVRGGPELMFEPKLIDARTGVGTQVTVGDVDGDARPDIVVGNKLGTSVVLNRGPGDAALALSHLNGIGKGEFAQAVRTSEPLSPEEELATFLLPPGFKAELVAAEPDIAKPMNMAFDADGRLWVTSSEEYPYAAPADRTGKDTIVVFEDRDGDGRRETVTQFADGLNIPIGLYPYRDGVICFSIPNIWFLRDTDGDGKCDVREKLYGPMGFERDTHGMCNSFTRGFDGWLYACHGFNNHTTVAGTDGHEITMQSGNTFRMRLDGSRIEHFSHGLVNPFGMAQTPSGDLLVADCHTKPITLILPNGYYDSFGKPHDGLGYVPPMMDHLHGSTAIGGIAQCQTDAWPDVYHGRTFGGNVMTSRVNMNSLRSFGDSSPRAFEEADFLTSGDSWFRPVDLKFGPDGALYVADFYNRIIGHYEVKLDHPGRDRHRGRIWKIVYEADDSRRDAGSERAAEQLAKPTSPEELFAMVRSNDLSRRMVAVDRLVDSHPEETEQFARAGLTDDVDFVRAHSLWMLQRLDRLSEAELTEASIDSSELGRTHVYRILRDRSKPLPTSRQIVARLLTEPSPQVTREAVLAAAHLNDPALVPDLMARFHATSQSDPVLKHVIRMALRDLLRGDGALDTLSDLAQADIELLAEICLALKTPAAGEFLVRHIEALGNVDPEQFASYVQFAARYVSEENVDRVVDVARLRFANDLTRQRELIVSIQTGLRERGSKLTSAARAWAVDVAGQLLRFKNGQPTDADSRSIVWSYVPYPDGSTLDDPFVPTLRRKSVDGMEPTPLVSTIPKGEQRTGLRRSGIFDIDGPFEFYMAGHDGFPDKPLGGLNFVRLRDARTHEVLTTWAPPRSDVAHRFEWTPSDPQNRAVYLEVIDGDTASAFAWLAVGRFSVAGLNESDAAAELTTGLQLARDLHLEELHPGLLTMLRQNLTSTSTSRNVAEALTAGSEVRLRALANCLAFSGLNAKQRSSIAEAISSNNGETAGQLLGECLTTATAAQQREIASILAASREGADSLVTACEKGQASPTLLQQGEVADAIATFSDANLSNRVQAIVAELPDFNAMTAQLIVDRRTAFIERSGDANAGAAVFKKNCANCHQIAGQGAKVGPNLDGVGKRGLDRILEDVLDPNRNVDINFRTTTVITDEGVVHSGLSRGVDGANLILIDNKGQQVTIPTDSIEEQVSSRRSLMPENLTESLSEPDFRDLVAWLLTQ